MQPLKLKERVIVCIERDGNHVHELEQQRDYLKDCFKNRNMKGLTEEG